MHNFTVCTSSYIERQTSLTSQLGRAIAQAVSRWLPTAVARVWSSGICGGQRGGFSPSTSVPANLHSSKFPIIIITRGGYNKPISGRLAEWTLLDSTPHNANYLILGVGNVCLCLCVCVCVCVCV
jgi:hypothetical protein